MKRHLGVVLAVLFFGGGDAAFGQALPNASRKDRPAQELVVKVRAAWKGEPAPFPEEVGAGVIVAVTPSAIYVATARHVVAQTQDVADNRQVDAYADFVWVTLPGAKAQAAASIVRVDSALRATGRLRLNAVANDRAETRRLGDELKNDTTLFAETNYDLTVVRVERNSQALAGWRPPALDRLGDVAAMRRGDEVTAIGCPGSNCWEVPPNGDVFVDVAGVRLRETEFQSGQLTFQTQVVDKGSSGGALFNANREVIGIVVSDGKRLAGALPINDVTNLLGRSGVPIDLRRARLPRDGYHLMMDLDVLVPVNPTAVPDSLSTETLLPSARLTFSKRARSSLTWHVGALRLAPYNTTIHAAMGGVGFTQRIGRLSLKPFAELGFGQVKARYDVGGYYRLPSGVTALPSPSAAFYTPLWVAERASSAGFGGGMQAELIVLPHISVAANIARWTFGLTPRARAIPNLFFGGGLRWSR